MKQRRRDIRAQRQAAQWARDVALAADESQDPTDFLAHPFICPVCQKTSPEPFYCDGCDAHSVVAGDTEEA